MRTFCVKNRWLWLAAALLLTAAPAVRAADGAAKEKCVWLMDAKTDMPFCRLRVPAEWLVEGNIVWTDARPAPVPAAWVRLTDPKTKLVYEAIQPVGSFMWKSGPDAALKDGELDAASLTYSLKPRTAEQLLNEYARPIVGKIAPNAKILWVRDQPGRAEAAERQLGLNPKEIRDIAARSGSKVDMTAAAMLVDNNGVKTYLNSAATAIDMPDRKDKTKSVIMWNWQTLTAVTAPAGVEPTQKELDDAFTGRWIVNDEWQTKVFRDRVMWLKDNYRKPIVMPFVDDFQKYYRQAWRSGAMLERPAEAADEPAKYSAPGDKTVASKAPAVPSVGYVNAIADALLLGGGAYGSSIGQLEPLMK